jgi:hypothetical protein
VAHRLVVGAPQPRVVRHGHLGGAAGPEHASPLGGGDVVLLDVLQHVEAEGEVDGAGREGEMPGVSLHHGNAAFEGGHRADVAQLEGHHGPAEGLQRPGVATSGGTHVEGPAGEKAAGELRHQVAALLVPPMAVLQGDESFYPGPAAGSTSSVAARPPARTARESPSGCRQDPRQTPDTHFEEGVQCDSERCVLSLYSQP